MNTASKIVKIIVTESTLMADNAAQGELQTIPHS